MSRNSLPPPSAAPSRSQHTPQSSLDLELQPLRHNDDDDTDYHSSDSAPSTDTPNPMARTRRAAPSGDSSTMNTSSSVEFRRKTVHPVEFDLNDSHISSASQTAALLERESFQLDSSIDPDKPPAGSFKELSKKDQRNFLLLVLLYFLQGVPMGLAMGSVPFLLKSRLSYGQIGVFTLASYPYSMKLLWSPIVDAIWSPRWGRRKSWIVPVQAVSAVALLWLGAHAERLMEEAEQRLYFFTFVFFVLVMLCATQDIAVDGWALTLLSPENLSYASTAQTVGLTAGQFLSFTVFLALSAPDFANRYFRSTPLDHGLITLSSYLTFWGWIYLLVTLGLAVLKREDRTLTRDGIGAVYRTMWRVMKLRHVQTFIVIHLISKIGFQANDAVTNLKLLDKGFSQEDLALTVLIDFPFELVLGYYAGKWCQDYMPMALWRWAFVGRIIAAMLAHLTVWVFPSDGHVGVGYLLVVITSHVFSTFTSTVMFVAGAAFHAKIADPEIGGTYMTLLATVSNLGGTFPRIFVLKMVDAFTQATCTPAGEKAVAFDPFSCALEGEKHRCRDMGGVCEVVTDGYYITNVLCVLVGVVTFWGYIRPATKRLSALPLKAWREASGEAGRAAGR
ncbi:MFS general substrate transporter [Ascodesmis nigricans]|uniref:MFS general substrate transporter n=1 Tax=Ascodesmis nigricans TaxID=341454 RepID=A0A4S2MM92_9PEZI|nr:MFS general substrate transporter [Ascodesmis nigricans]